MRVLQVVPELNLGGVEKGTLELAKFLALNGHLPVVISNGGELERELREFGIKHYKLPVHRKSPFSLLLLPKILAILRKEQIDILHARSRVPALLSYLAFRYYLRDQQIGRFLNFVPSFITTAHGYYRQHLFSRIMAKGKLVICPSRVIAKHMVEDFGVGIEKIRIVPRGVELNQYEFILPSQRDWKHPVIAIIARISPLKGHPEFIRAFREILKIKPFAKAWIIGGPSKGKQDYLYELQLLVKRFGLENTIEFLGPRYDIPSLLKKINILVQPSRVPEAFGRVIIEAQASGVLVVATNLGGYREIIEDKVTGMLFPPRDEKKLVQILTRLVKDPKSSDTLALAARRKVEKLYQLDKVNAQILDVYFEAGKKINILILKLGALGDAILCIPSLRAVRKKFPQANICLLTSSKVAKVFKACPYIDKLIIYPEGPYKYLSLLRCLKKIKKLDSELSLDLQNNKISRLLSYLAGVPQRYGFLNGKLSFLLNKGEKLPESLLSAVDQQLVLLSKLGIRNVDKRLELWLEEEELARAQSYLDAHWLSKKQILVGINLGASKKWLSKKWSLKKVIQLIDELGYHNIRCLLTGTRDEKWEAMKIVASCKNKPIDAVASTDIPLLIALIKKCAVYITSDSAPLHIAAAVSTPVIALFGPTDPRRHLPPGEEVHFIFSRKDCSPCYKPECRKDETCMDAISVLEVKDKILEILKEKVEGLNIKQSF